MGLRGPPPKPTKLRLLEGNPAKRPLPKAEPQPIGPPEKPDFITGEAAKEWDRCVASMPPGFFGAADVPTLAVLSVSWVLFRQSLALVAREGMTSIGSQGQKVAHGALAVAAKQSELIMRASDRLGLSPAARARLEMPGQPQTGKFDGLIGRPRGDLRLIGQTSPAAPADGAAGDLQDPGERR